MKKLKSVIWQYIHKRIIAKNILTKVRVNNHVINQKKVDFGF